MMTYPPVQIVAIDNVVAQSPLQIEERKLEEAGSAVKFEFITSIVKDLGITFRTFRSYSNERQVDMARRVLYIQAVQRAILVFRADVELAAIINRVPLEGDYKPIALDFEILYHKKFGRWPPIVPVNVDALTERMLNDLEVR